MFLPTIYVKVSSAPQKNLVAYNNAVIRHMGINFSWGVSEVSEVTHTCP